MLIAVLISLETIDSRHIDAMGQIVALLNKRGFGCGGPYSRNELQCHTHCKNMSMVGFKYLMYL